MAPAQTGQEAPGPVGNGSVPLRPAEGRRSAPCAPDTTGLVLGPKGGGGEAAWFPAESPHLLVVGGTGGGKGGTIRYLASQALEQGWHLVILDPKGSGEHRWAAERGVRVVHDLEPQVEELRRAAQDVRERCGLLWEHGADRVSVLAPELRPAPVLVVVWTRPRSC
jgi:DNA segregation ATPase FtsK/SpoIIIE, S-DNA-T family